MEKEDKSNKKDKVEDEIDDEDDKEVEDDEDDEEDEDEDELPDLPDKCPICDKVLKNLLLHIKKKESCGSKIDPKLYEHWKRQQNKYSKKKYQSAYIKKESTTMHKQDTWKLRSIKKPEMCILIKESIRRPKQNMLRMGSIGSLKLSMKKHLDLFVKFVK